MMDWQPIETAPRDGTSIWVYNAIAGLYVHSLGTGNDRTARGSAGSSAASSGAATGCRPDAAAVEQTAQEAGDG
jgi:hypothetical protein